MRKLPYAFRIEWLAWLGVSLEEGRGEISHSLNFGTVDRRIESPLAIAFVMQIDSGAIKCAISAPCIVFRVISVLMLMILAVSLGAAQDRGGGRTRAPSMGR